MSFLLDSNLVGIQYSSTEPEDKLNKKIDERIELNMNRLFPKMTDNYLGSHRCMTNIIQRVEEQTTKEIDKKVNEIVNNEWKYNPIFTNFKNIVRRDTEKTTMKVTEKIKSDAFTAKSLGYVNTVLLFGLGAVMYSLHKK